jgi:hypothetical protein
MAWRDLLTYWRDRHVDGRPPSRRQIDPPIEIPELLPNLMILTPAEGGFRVRIAGSELVRRAGRDNTGIIITAEPSQPRGIPTFFEFLSLLSATRRPVLYAVSPGEHAAAGAVGLILPLIDGDNRVEMILGGLFYEPSPTRDLGGSWSPGALTLLNLDQEVKRDHAVRYGL